MSAPANLIALLHGPDQPGLVARVASWIYDRGGNILHADQHRDREAGIFFQRVEWQPAFANTVADTPSESLTPAAKASATIQAIADRSQGRPVNLRAAIQGFHDFAETSLGM